MSKKASSANVKGNESQEFMLAQYELIHQRYLFEREVGEKRLNVFLTLITAVLGGLLLASTSQVAVADLPFLSVAGLALLLIFGFVTFDRIRLRTIACISWLTRANRVLKYFLDRHEELKLFAEPYAIVESSETWGQSLMLNGLVRTVAILNTLTAIAIGAIACENYGSAPRPYWAIVLAAAAVWLVHVLLWRNSIRNLIEFKSHEEGVR